jgi:hypothetical protein
MFCFIVASVMWSACSVMVSLTGNPVVGMLCAGMAFFHLYLSVITQPPPILKPWSYEDLTELRPPLRSE